MSNDMDEIPVELAIELYYEKHHAIRNGDMTTLIRLKNEYPEMFIEKKDREIHSLIAYAKAFEKTEQYKILRKMRVREMLKVIPAEFEKH